MKPTTFKNFARAEVLLLASWVILFVMIATIGFNNAKISKLPHQCPKLYASDTELQAYVCGVNYQRCRGLDLDNQTDMCLRIEKECKELGYWGF